MRTVFIQTRLFGFRPLCFRNKFALLFTVGAALHCWRCSSLLATWRCSSLSVSLKSALHPRFCWNLLFTLGSVFQKLVSIKLMSLSILCSRNKFALLFTLGFIEICSSLSVLLKFPLHSWFCWNLLFTLGSVFQKLVSIKLMSLSILCSRNKFALHSRSSGRSTPSHLHC
jgi:hypothetical protein